MLFSLDQDVSNIPAPVKDFVAREMEHHGAVLGITPESLYHHGTAHLYRTENRMSTTWVWTCECMEQPEPPQRCQYCHCHRMYRVEITDEVLYGTDHRNVGRYANMPVPKVLRRVGPMPIPLPREQSAS